MSRLLFALPVSRRPELRSRCLLHTISVTSPFDPEIDTGFDPELDANPDLDGDASLDDVPLTDEQWAEASARPRPYPAMDPEVRAKLKAEQTARVEADRQERIEAAARQTPVFDGEMANTGMLRL
jgi:hypothetical protein